MVTFLTSVIVNLCCITLFSETSDGFSVNGTISMENTTDWATVASGDSVLFTFSVTFNLESSNENLLIAIDGDTLEFYNDSSLDAMDWILADDTGIIATRNSSIIVFDEQLKPTLTFGSDPIYQLNITHGLKSGKWSFNGRHKMTVTDDVSPGSIIRGVMTLIPALGPNSTLLRTVASNYYTVPYPEITAENRSLLSQPIMGIFKTHVTMRSSRDLVDSVVECFTLPEMTSKEVRLTVQQITVYTNKTYGMPLETLSALNALTGSKISSLGSYQNNIGVLELPFIPLANLSDEVVVTAEFSVRVEDYSDLKEGDQWPVNMGTNFQSNVLWVGRIEVTIDAPVVRQPALAVSMQQIGQCAYDGSSTLRVRVIVSHAQDSTGTAYNVTVNVYLADYMVMTTKTFTEPKENSITVEQSGTVITTEITRLTFSDPFTLEVTLALDLSDPQVQEASNRVISGETIYNDRWANITDLVSPTVYLSLKPNKVCAKRLTWTTSSTCNCSYDPKILTCGCCVAGACQCGEARPHACAPCNEMWRCTTYKNYYEQVSYLSSQNILCDAYNMRRGGASGVSCHKITPAVFGVSPALFLELSPRVAVVTGTAPETGNLYGISNNGLTYVVSTDSGVTWTSLQDDDYSTATSNSSFLWSTFS